MRIVQLYVNNFLAAHRHDVGGLVRGLGRYDCTLNGQAVLRAKRIHIVVSDKPAARLLLVLTCIIAGCGSFILHFQAFGGAFCQLSGADKYNRLAKKDNCQISFKFDTHICNSITMDGKKEVTIFLTFL